ncbi:methyltransferase domain-containing protein [Evansella sp. LMS18]|uniref:SAM-dependent methyltransferase n=1 Tax=Evansella sp. LMS18 TaxID=2924033 RepID=UPI0020D13826|nr:methyltransferase domain-containing protein [Evansella sp. LMS18]UTR09906.1 methyltransferase domain-containing protein [Evansella sp. LMS18]
MEERFPLSGQYDRNWIDENKMGPNPLWLLEDLMENMQLKKGMRVLDMGCGKAITSIFLAKEFGVQVWANDLWINPDENALRIKEAGAEDLVFPIKAEAHSLPYSESFFDAIISIDAYHYFGTSDLYLPWYFQKLVKKGGEIGIVVPAVKKEVRNEEDIPEKLREYWDADFYTFHTSEWWANHWRKSKAVDIKLAEYIKAGREIWLNSKVDLEALAADEEQILSFVKMIGKRKQ